jgi:hypothetical protein
VVWGVILVWVGGYRPDREFSGRETGAGRQKGSQSGRDRAMSVIAARQDGGESILRISDFRWEHDQAGAVDDLLALLAIGRRRRAA